MSNDMATWKPFTLHSEQELAGLAGDAWLAAALDDFAARLVWNSWHRTRVDRLNVTTPEGLHLAAETAFVHGEATVRLLLIDPEVGRRTDVWTGTVRLRSGVSGGGHNPLWIGMLSALDALVGTSPKTARELARGTDD